VRTLGAEGFQTAKTKTKNNHKNTCVDRQEVTKAARAYVMLGAKRCSDGRNKTKSQENLCEQKWLSVGSYFSDGKHTHTHTHTHKKTCVNKVNNRGISMQEQTFEGLRSTDCNISVVRGKTFIIQAATQHK